MDWAPDKNRIKRFRQQQFYKVSSFFQGVRRLFVLAFDNTNNGANKVEKNNPRKYSLSRANITNYNVLIDGRDDYTTGCLLVYQYFKDHYQLIAVNLSEQKELDADSRAIQQIDFMGC